MKADVLTVAAIVFVVGVLASSIDIKDVFEDDPAIAKPQAELHQGVVVAQNKHLVESEQ